MATLEVQSDTSSCSSTSTPSPVRAEPNSRRLLRNRSINKLEDDLHKVKRRTIAKPRKLNPATLGSDASEKLIQKLYLNKKMAKLKPTNLETIFETPKEGKNDAIIYISSTRFRRSLDFKTYPHVPKPIKEKRRKRIKQMLGGIAKHKKMSMDDFMAHFTKLQEEQDKDLE